MTDKRHVSSDREITAGTSASHAGPKSSAHPTSVLTCFATKPFVVGWLPCGAGVPPAETRLKLTADREKFSVHGVTPPTMRIDDQF